MSEQRKEKSRETRRTEDPRADERAEMRKLREELQASQDERARGVRGYTVEKVTARMREAVRQAETKTDGM